MVKVKDRGSCRGETEREKRRLQVKMFQVVVSRIPTQPGARVRATQEGVSCLTSRLEPTSIDGRPAEMPRCRVESALLREARVAWHFPGCAVAKSIQLPWSRICLFLSSLPVIVAHKDKQDEENRKRECRQLCVSSCPKQTLKLPLATLVGNVSSRRWARRGEVAAPCRPW